MWVKRWTVGFLWNWQFSVSWLGSGNSDNFNLFLFIFANYIYICSTFILFLHIFLKSSFHHLASGIFHIINGTPSLSWIKWRYYWTELEYWVTSAFTRNMTFLAHLRSSRLTLFPLDYKQSHSSVVSTDPLQCHLPPFPLLYTKCATVPFILKSATL